MEYERRWTSALVTAALPPRRRRPLVFFPMFCE